MRYKLWFIFLFLLITRSIYAQSEIGFRLDIDAPTYKLKKGYLFTYRGGETYLLDSCEIDKRGKSYISFDKMLPAGEYLFHIKPNREIPLLIDNGQELIKLSIAKETRKNKIFGSSDTHILWEYLTILKEYNEEQSKLLDVDQPQTDQGKLKVLLHKSDIAFRRKEELLIQNNEGTWVGTYLRAMQPVSLPYNSPKSHSERVANSNFMKYHYFDNIDMNDVRLLRTNYLYSYIDNYQNNWIVQDPDSLAKSAVNIVGLANKNSVFQHQLLSYFISNSITSTQMGMENIWARLAEEYLFNNENSGIDEIQMMELKSQYDAIRYNRLGMKAHDLQLELISGDDIRLYDISANSLILCFYNPECSHCRVEIEYLQKNIVPLYKDKGLKIVAVNIFPQKDKWQEFVNQFGMDQWFNCADPKYKSSYWIYYNTSSIPALYVLDRNKKIIGKDLNNENLKRLLARTLK